MSQGHPPIQETTATGQMTKFPGALDAFGDLNEYTPTHSLQICVNRLAQAINAMQERMGVEGVHGRIVHKTVTLTSAAAATPVEVFSNDEIGAANKFYLMGYVLKVDGATDWATTATVKIQDTNASAVDFVTLAASALDGNEVHGPWSDSATMEDAFSEGTGGTQGKGVQIVGDANGTGSSLKVTVWGIVKAA